MKKYKTSTDEIIEVYMWDGFFTKELEKFLPPETEVRVIKSLNPLERIYDDTPMTYEKILLLDIPRTRGKYMLFKGDGICLYNGIWAQVSKHTIKNELILITE